VEVGATANLSAQDVLDWESYDGSGSALLSVVMEFLPETSTKK
jgi:hypothetical protein